ncbi:hypothetical protein ABPG72_009290 [Tetrahymena utriculariae]
MYIASLEVIDYRLEVSIELIDESQCKWKELFSIEQIYKLNKFFLQFTDMQEVYGIISRLIKNSINSISRNDSKMLIQFEFEYVHGKIQFTLQLHQCQINANDAVVKLCETISTLQIKSNDHQKQLEQILKDQSSQTEQIKDFLVKQIDLMKKEFAQQIKSLKTQHQNQIQEIKNEIALNQKIFSNIISLEEQEIIKKWISVNQINLQQIYRATYHGFQIEKIYEQCKDKSKVILLIKTKENKRFGFYADCQIKNYNNQWLAQNPNNIFLFSLDLKQKYPSNESNYQHAFYSCNANIAVGSGCDIKLYSNSNTNNDSYVNSSGYGKKEGLTGYALNGGSLNFTTSEVEIFEVISI